MDRFGVAVGADAAAAGHADRLLAWQPRRLNPHRVGVLVHEARLYADPDRAIDEDTLFARASAMLRRNPEGVKTQLLLCGE